jgi:hypothetical protein
VQLQAQGVKAAGQLLRDVRQVANSRQVEVADFELLQLGEGGQRVERLVGRVEVEREQARGKPVPGAELEGQLREVAEGRQVQGSKRDVFCAQRLGSVLCVEISDRLDQADTACVCCRRE